MLSNKYLLSGMLFNLSLSDTQTNSQVNLFYYTRTILVLTELLAQTFLSCSKLKYLLSHPLVSLMHPLFGLHLK